MYNRQSAVLDVRGVGKKRITLNTYAVQEKAAALDTLVRGRIFIGGIRTYIRFWL